METGFYAPKSHSLPNPLSSSPKAALTLSTRPEILFPSLIEYRDQQVEVLIQYLQPVIYEYFITMFRQSQMTMMEFSVAMREPFHSVDNQTMDFEPIFSKKIPLLRHVLEDIHFVLFQLIHLVKSPPENGEWAPSKMNVSRFLLATMESVRQIVILSPHLVSYLSESPVSQQEADQARGVELDRIYDRLDRYHRYQKQFDDSIREAIKTNLKAVSDAPFLSSVWDWRPEILSAISDAHSFVPENGKKLLSSSSSDPESLAWMELSMKENFQTLAQSVDTSIRHLGELMTVQQKNFFAECETYVRELTNELQSGAQSTSDSIKNLNTLMTKRHTSGLESIKLLVNELKVELLEPITLATNTLIESHRNANGDIIKMNAYGSQSSTTDLALQIATLEEMAKAQKSGFETLDRTLRQYGGQMLEQTSLSSSSSVRLHEAMLIMHERLSAIQKAVENSKDTAFDSIRLLTETITPIVTASQNGVAAFDSLIELAQSLDSFMATERKTAQVLESLQSRFTTAVTQTITASDKQEISSLVAVPLMNQIEEMRKTWFEEIHAQNEELLVDLVQDVRSIAPSIEMGTEKTVSALKSLEKEMKVQQSALLSAYKSQIQSEVKQQHYHAAESAMKTHPHYLQRIDLVKGVQEGSRAPSQTPLLQVPVLHHYRRGSVAEPVDHLYHIEEYQNDPLEGLKRTSNDPSVLEPPASAAPQASLSDEEEEKKLGNSDTKAPQDPPTPVACRPVDAEAVGEDGVVVQVQDADSKSVSSSSTNALKSRLSRRDSRPKPLNLSVSSPAPAPEPGAETQTTAAPVVKKKTTPAKLGLGSRSTRAKTSKSASKKKGSKSSAKEEETESDNDEEFHSGSEQ